MGYLLVFYLCINQVNFNYEYISYDRAYYRHEKNCQCLMLLIKNCISSFKFYVMAQQCPLSTQSSYIFSLDANKKV